MLTISYEGWNFKQPSHNWSAGKPPTLDSHSIMENLSANPTVWTEKVYFQLNIQWSNEISILLTFWLPTVVCKIVHKIASVWCKIALGEVGVSLPWWCHPPVLLAPGYWSIFLNLKNWFIMERWPLVIFPLVKVETLNFTG